MYRFQIFITCRSPKYRAECHVLQNLHAICTRIRSAHTFFKSTSRIWLFAPFKSERFIIRFLKLNFEISINSSGRLSKGKVALFIFQRRVIGCVNLFTRSRQNRNLIDTFGCFSNLAQKFRASRCSSLGLSTKCRLSHSKNLRFKILASEASEYYSRISLFISSRGFKLKFSNSESN